MGTKEMINEINKAFEKISNGKYLKYEVPILTRNYVEKLWSDNELPNKATDEIIKEIMKQTSPSAIVNEILLYVQKFSKNASFLIKGTIEKKTKESIPFLKNIANNMIEKSVAATLSEKLMELYVESGSAV